jgi:hypothetical protein
MESRGSSVSTVSVYRLDYRGSIPGRDKIIFPLASVSRPAFGPPSLLSNMYRGSFPGAIERPGRDTNHYPHVLPRSRIMGALSPLAHKRLHGV